MKKKKHVDIKKLRFETQIIHSEENYSEETGSVIPPVFLTSTFRSGNAEHFDYTRSGNPNFRNLEANIAAVENAEFATIFSSGVGAMTAIISSLESGDRVLAEENIYGCTYRLFEQVFKKMGIEINYVDFTKKESMDLITQIQPKVIWLESPTNPLLKIIDIERISKFAKTYNSLVVVDNTFASGYFQKPLDLGADISLVSTTKYLNGHSDCIGGAVCTNSLNWHEKMVFSQKALGLNPSPFDSWLISRGIKTLSVRMDRHLQNAFQLAQFLQDDKAIKSVLYPFLPDHPQHDLARKQMTGGGGIVTVIMNLDKLKTRQFLDNLYLFCPAESLGGVESLVCHPASMSHASVPLHVRENLGIVDSMVRFSVGIENIDDLIEDISQAIKEVDK